MVSIAIPIRCSASTLPSSTITSGCDIAIDVNYRGAKGGSDVTLDQVALGFAGGRVEHDDPLQCGAPDAPVEVVQRRGAPEGRREVAGVDP